MTPESDYGSDEARISSSRRMCVKISKGGSVCVCL